MEFNLVVEGLKFMVLGMGTVFLFLLLMVWILKLQSKIITKYFPQKPEQPSQSFNGASLASENKDASLVAVITAAIEMFRQQHKK
ncbi:MAG: OadG family protein [Sulfurospirillaceae bacterium]|nr:OadG family protein [Sulfurospirillaceae bacterium]MCK9546629.1 OadG family protein [Sulfurospirillaceae bacterium]MDY0238834.1 OadG family protein [Campylobacterales bacterium]NLM99180.1 OadG family protein [Campylobacteraceae bacterium]